jgi:hypothetical protein
VRNIEHHSLMPVDFVISVRRDRGRRLAALAMEAGIGETAVKLPESAAFQRRIPEMLAATLHSGQRSSSAAMDANRSGSGLRMSVTSVRHCVIVRKPARAQRPRVPSAVASVSPVAVGKAGTSM